MCHWCFLKSLDFFFRFFNRSCYTSLFVVSWRSMLLCLAFDFLLRLLIFFTLGCFVYGSLYLFLRLFHLLGDIDLH